MLARPWTMISAISPLADAAICAIELPLVAILTRPPSLPALPGPFLSLGISSFSSRFFTVASAST